MYPFCTICPFVVILSWCAFFSAVSAADVVSEPVSKSPEAVVLGQAPWQFRTTPGWGGSMEGKGPFHGGLVVLSDGHVIGSSDGEKGLLEFTANGELVKAFAPTWKGIHQLALVKEGDQEFLYGAHLLSHQVVKLRRDGTAVWTLGTPPVPTLYPTADTFKPTSVAVASDGSLFVSDGYGRFVIHRYDAERRYVGYFGDAAGPGQLKNPHAIFMIQNQGEERLLVADRANRRLLLFDLKGIFLRECATDLRLPSSFAHLGDYLVIAELEGRVVIVDADFHIVSTLGENLDKNMSGRFAVAPSRWIPGRFNAPHAVGTDSAGNIYVTEWNKTGRFHKLEFIKP